MSNPNNNPLMPNRFDASLLDAALETFASMAFFFPADGTGQRPAVNSVRASVTFKGPMCGTLWLAVDAAMLTPLAANLLGLDDDQFPSTQQQQDSLKELLNVICGNLLPIIDTPQAVYDVGSPRILAVDTPPIAMSHLCGQASLAMDEGQAHLTLFLDDEA